MNDDLTTTEAATGEEPEGLVPDLQLADHLRGYWPSSKNVTQ